MSEIISLHIGSPGVQIGNKLWNLFSTEHSLNHPSHLKSTQMQIPSNLSTFYSVHPSSQYYPRALFIDNEISLSSSLTFPNISSLPSDHLILAEDSEGNYSKSHSSLVSNEIQEKIRRLVENCSSLQGFLIYSSTAGGLSGLASKILENLSDDLPKNTKLGITLFPSRESNDLSVFNFLASFGNFLNRLDSCIYLENESVERIYKKILSVENFGFMEINDLIAELVSNLTFFLRFDENQEFRLRNFVSDFIPYPSAKYLITSIAPLMKKDENLPDPYPGDLCNFAFSNDYLFSNTFIERGKFLGASVSFRGNIVNKYISSCVASIKASRRLRFVDWTPNCLKCWINKKVLPGLPESLFTRRQKSVCMVANSTAIKENFFRFKKNFDKIENQQRIRLKFYENGFEEGCFREWSEELGNICEDYLEMEKDFGEEEVE